MTVTVGDSMPVGQPSPPTQRVVRVIELLAEQTGGRLTLAEIVRRTGFSRATAHAVLTQLTIDGWVAREDGQFAIGAGFVALARQAERGYPLRRLAAPMIHELAADLGMPAFLAERVAEQITVTELVGVPDMQWIRPGRRIALRPPVCREFVAWAPEAERQRWIDSAPPGARDRLHDVLEVICDRGYAVERLTGDHAEMIDALASLRDSPVSDTVRSRVAGLLAELTTIDYLPEESVGVVAVVTIGAPIIDSEGTVIASIVVCPNREMSADEMAHLGTSVAAAADRVAHALAR
ncbi:MULTISPECIES: helix-turn-helix domain-containing protein [Actinomycetes]|uniref:IclR family transcriptional regulator n=1 Tax=Actinomycetes TaxID=1760 RepID=UPI0004C0E673|nr:MULTISPECIES: helix-turn-helix domain-containing protein [Actinomycetes]